MPIKSNNNRTGIHLSPLAPHFLPIRMGNRPHFAVIGCIGEHNAGDEALFLSTVQQLRLRWPDARITAFSNEVEQTRTIYGVDTVSAVGLLAPSTALAALRDGALWGSIRTVATCDCLVVCGGELIRTDFGMKATLSIFDRIMLARLFGKPRVFLGVGAGALDDPRQMRLIRFGAKGAPVLAREAESCQRLRAAGVGLPATGPDMALLLQSTTTANAPVLSPWCSVSLRDPATTRSCRNMGIPREEFVRRIASALDHVVEALGLVPVFIPLGFSPDDDRPFHREVQSRMRHGARTVQIEDELPVDELLGMIGRANLVLGMRLHSCIFAFNQGVPVVGVAYDAKVRKQFEHFDLEHFCTAIDGPDILKERLTDAIRDADAARLKMRQRLATIRAEAGALLDSIFGSRR